MDNEIKILAKYSEYPYRTLKKIEKMAETYRDSKSFDPVNCRDQVRNLLPNLDIEDEKKIMGYIASIALDYLQKKCVWQYMLNTQDLEILSDEVKTEVCNAMGTYKYDKPISSYMCTIMKNHIRGYYNNLQKVPINPHYYKTMGQIVEYEAKHNGIVDISRMARELKIKDCVAKRLYKIHRINTSHDDHIEIDCYGNIPTMEEMYIREAQDTEVVKNFAEAALAVFSPEIAYAVSLYSHVKSINKMKPYVLRFRLFTKYFNEELNGDNQDFAKRVFKGLCVSDVSGLGEFIETKEEANIVKTAFFKADNDLKAINNGVATEESCLGNKLNLGYKLSQIFGTTKTPRTRENVILAKKFQEELELRELNLLASRMNI